MTEAALLAYVSDVRRLRRVHDVLAEASLYPALDRLLSDSVRTRHLDAVVAQQARTDYGLPDFVVARPALPIGYVEAKRPGTRIDRLAGRDRAQLEAFLNLDNVLYTDYLDWRLYQDGELVATASLGELELLDDAGPVPSSARLAEVDELLERFLSRLPTSPRTAGELARSLARATRVLRDATSRTLEQDPSGPVARLEVLWANLLFDDATGADFADVYAQTVSYGLLTARLESQGPLTVHAAADVLRGHHPFLSSAFRLLTEFEVLDVLGWAVDVVTTTVRDVGADTFRRSRHRDDPLLYFYEDFLAAYDERLRKRRGVYYTPPSVVDFQVGALADLLAEQGRPRLLADDVTALDPACGTGTYALGLLDETERRVKERDGDGVVEAAMTRAAEHVVGFELLVGPYTVAHQRVGARLQAAGVAARGVRVFLVDTLAEPHEPQTGQLSFLDAQLVEERAAADAVKTSERVMMVVGNPPYQRGRGRAASDWLQSRLMPRFTDPVRQSARVNLKNLADPYVQFYRWSLWKLFESVPAGGPRLLSLITNRSYLLDYAFEGLRRALREDFDEIWIVDLEGESKGPVKTENVFDIQVGVCILVALRRESAAPSASEAVVHYTRLTGSRAQKEQALTTPLRHQAWSTAATGWGEPFLPVTGRAWRRWIGLDELMPVRQSGVQTKRDRLVVAPTTARLAAQLDRFVAAESEQERRSLFRETSARSVPPARWDPTRIRPYAYRPLSRCRLYDAADFIDRPRPRLHGLLHPGQRFFVTLPKGHGEGPAVFQHTELPDLHAFRGSVGGHVFPLWLDKHGQPNLPPGLLDRLQQQLGADVAADSVFDYTYGSLSAPAYSQLFREELAQGFPRVPFPVQRRLFDALADTGGRLRLAHDLDRHERLPRLEGRPGPVTAGRWQDDRLHVAADASVPDVPEAAWLYEVSGYRVIARWLQQRQGLDLAADLELVDELRRVVAAVLASVALGAELDAALRDVLDGDTLGRASLLPLDASRMAAERGAHPEIELQSELRLWDELSDEALVAAEDFE